MKASITALLLLASTVAGAQKLPSFGKIDKEEFQTTSCAYDPDAVAEYLIDYGRVNYFFNSTDFVNETEHRIRIKILKEKGLELANVRLVYYAKGNRQHIGRVEGYTYNLASDGTVETIKLEKKAILEQKVDEQLDMLVFSMPNVKVGSVIEYRFTHMKKNYVEIDDWNFQRSYPVRHSQYEVTLPSFLEFTYQIKRVLPVKEDNNEYSKTKTFIMNDIPGLDREPYMSCAKDYLQRVDFQLRAINKEPVLSTWKELTTKLIDDEDFGMQLRKNVLKNTLLEQQLATQNSNYRKMVTVLNFVKKEVAWNGQEGIWCRGGIKQALEKHVGNSAELNLLLINLLRDAGITAYPVLVSTRENGKINTLYPFIYQFNNVYAYVVVDDKGYILDATNKMGSPRMVPWDVQFTEGYIVDKDLSQFVQLMDTQHPYRLLTSLSAQVDENGRISGEATVQAYDYARAPRLSSLEKGEDQLLRDFFAKPHPSFQFDSLRIVNKDADSLPLQATVNFKSQLNNTGDYYFYSPNFLLELEDNDFIRERRFTDIEFGYLQQYTINASIRFPEGLILEELPKNIKMIMPDTSIVMQRLVQKNDNSVMFRITLEFRRPSFYTDEYEFFREFYGKLFELMNEQLVFRRKAKP